MKYTITVGFLIILSYCFLSCTDDPSQPEGPYVPQIPNQWRDSLNAEHVFNLETDDSGKNEGSITGNEDSAFVYLGELTGTFKNRNIEFTVNRPTENVKFTGTFITDRAIRLTYKYGTIIIIHD